MTGINASKIIQNLEILNSFCLSSLAFFLFWFFHFAIWVRCIPPTPPPVERGRWPKTSFASSTQPSFSSRTGAPYVCRSGRWLLCLSAMNTNSRNWGPIGLGNQLLTALIPRGGWQFGNWDPQTQYGLQ